MEIYIPIIPILWGFGIYVLIGLVLIAPIALWQNRFISGNHKGLSRVQWKSAIPLGAIAWPIFLIWTIKTEIRYRKKGYL